MVLLAFPVAGRVAPSLLLNLPCEIVQSCVLLTATMLCLVPRLLERKQGNIDRMRDGARSVWPLISECRRTAPRPLSTRMATVVSAIEKASRSRGPTAVSKPGPMVRQDSKVPVQPPSLVAKGFSEQVDELLELITPTAECERVVQDLAQTVKTLVRKHWPSASVLGVVSGEITQCTSFGVAVPEVDIIVRLKTQELAWPLMARLSRSGVAANKTDTRKLQKSAIRICTDALVSEGGFKFRRSAFRGKEPKVTLMAPRSLGLTDQNVPIDFSVNADTPLCNAYLLAEIGRIDRRAKALALMVRRWAKDRGICHAAKGHLPPYAWTLLTIYFLQVGFKDDSLLPPLSQLKLPAISNLTIWDGKDESSELHLEKTQLSVGQLFQEFICFYLESVKWEAECVSVRLGERLPPSTSLPLHKVERSNGSLAPTPAIEDPFLPEQNIAQCLSADGLERLDEELQRAKALIETGTCLTKLLIPWVPPEQRTAADGPRPYDLEEDDEEEDVEAEGDFQASAGRRLQSRAPSSAAFAEAVSPPPGLAQIVKGLESRGASSKQQQDDKRPAKSSEIPARRHKGTEQQPPAPCHPWAKRKEEPAEETKSGLPQKGEEQQASSALHPWRKQKQEAAQELPRKSEKV